MFLDLGGMEHRARRAVMTCMRLHGRWAPLVAGVATLGVAGCGTSAPVIKPTVNVAITAPTSGATVGVRDLTVTGTVAPATAQVLVAGQPATVQDGSFRRTLRLHGSAQTVTVTAQAAGYAPAQANTQVSYSAGLAAQLAAASRALAAPRPSAPASLSGSPASASLLAQAVALPKAAPAPKHTTPTRRTGSTTTRSSSTAPAPSASPPTASTPPTPAPAPPTPSPVTTTPSPSPAPVTTPPAPIPPSPAEIAAHVKQQWDSNCLQKHHGAKEVPYCTCIYTHLERTGAFKTPASVKALVRRVNRYIRTGDASHITRAIIRALSTCQARFPASQPLGGRMSVTPLSGSHHQPATPAPTTPLPAGPRPTPISPNLGTGP